MEIIIVERDHNLAALIGFALQQCGYDVRELKHHLDVLAVVKKEQPCAVIIGAEQVSGAVELCRAIRAAADIPIILINGPDQENDEIAALDRGADVYMSQPLDLRMLCARVRALVRRTRSMHFATPIRPYPPPR